MRVVSDRSDAEVAHQKALQEIRWPLRELAANILRVARGAGKPWEIATQAGAVIDAFDAYRGVVGHYPSSHEISAALQLDRWGEEHSFDEWTHGIETMVRGSLQMAASQLLGQSTQEAAGSRELIDGLRVIERIRDENRRGVRRPKPFTERLD